MPVRDSIRRRHFHAICRLFIAVDAFAIQLMLPPIDLRLLYVRLDL